jgi:hypothetical protein
MLARYRFCNTRKITRPLVSLLFISRRQQTQTMSLKLTAEQETILATVPRPGLRVLINAYAGTGKTTTCRAIVERHGVHETLEGDREHNSAHGAGHRFLYLAFNKSIQREAEIKFANLEFVDCRTAHSVALEFARTQLPALRIQATMQTKHPKARFLLKEFFLGEASALPGGEEDQEIEAQGIWRRMCAGTVPMTHDAYLKYFCLHPQAAQWLAQRYDSLIIDEAQDISAVNVSFLLSLPQCLYFVGDQNKIIYAFRNTKNALARIARLPTTAQQLVVHELTQSFRFGRELADVANTLLRRFQLDRGGLVGAAHETVIDAVHASVSGVEVPPCQALDADRVWAVIGRTNAGVFRFAVQQAQLGKTIHFAFRDPNTTPVLQVIEEALAKYTTRGDYLKLPQLNKDLAAALEREDVEQLRVLKLLKKSGAANVRRMVAQVKQQIVPERKAQFILGTVHSHKGLEWDSVALLEDFVPLERLEKQLDDFCAAHNIEDRADERAAAIVEEIHLYYVAATRAKHRLVPNTSLAKLLGL